MCCSGLPTTLGCHQSASSLNAICQAREWFHESIVQGCTQVTFALLWEWPQGPVARIWMQHIQQPRSHLQKGNSVFLSYVIYVIYFRLVKNLFSQGSSFSLSGLSMVPAQWCSLWALMQPQNITDPGCASLAHKPREAQHLLVLPTRQTCTHNQIYYYNAQYIVETNPKQWNNVGIKEN